MSLKDDMKVLIAFGIHIENLNEINEDFVDSCFNELMKELTEEHEIYIK